MCTFSSQTKSLYGFHILNGQLIQSVYPNYVESMTKSYFPKKRYRFQKGMGVAAINEDRLDRYLNGYLYTFDPDEKRALSIMRSTVREKLAAARQNIEKLERKLKVLDAIGEEKDYE